MKDTHINLQHNTLEDDLSFSKLADTAYSFCVSLFGSPVDSDRKYSLWKGETSWCGYNRITREYIIQISNRYKTPQQLYASVAHEMFHRVIQCKPGAHKEAWLSETLAFLTQQWFLNACSYGGYADYIRGLRIDQLDHVDVSVLKKARRGKAFIFRGYYPDNFGVNIQRLAIALESLLPQAIIADIVEAKSIQVWCATLPSEYKAPICHILQVPNSEPFHDRPEVLSNFGTALDAIGDRPGALNAYQAALALEPDKPEIHIRLGDMLCATGKYAEASAVWQRALQLQSHSLELYWSICTACLRWKHYNMARTWLYEASNVLGQSSLLLYFLGCIAYKEGDYTTTADYWDYAIDLNTDVESVNQVRKALTELQSTILRPEA
jgi:tetratricopeptide (TPR) repeat protein